MWVSRTAVLHIIMNSEIENVIKEMECGKTSGSEDIRKQIIKALDDECINTIT